MYRVVSLVAFLLAVHSAISASAQEFPIPTVTIAGGSPAFDVRLAPADADAFRRRVNQPPRLEDEPEVSGEHYVVTTSYWASAVRLRGGEEFFDVEVQADYYPDGGFVRTEVEGNDVWIVLDLRQRAILDRYIRLATEGALSEAPSTLDVLAAVSGSESITLTSGPDVVPPDTASSLLTALAQANPSPFVEIPATQEAGDDGFWLSANLLEGRSLRYYYDGATLTEALGTERYDASSVADVLAAITPAAVPAIEQEEPAGSALWWVVAAGGGGVLLGAAIWLERRHRPITDGRRRDEEPAAPANEG